MSNFSRQLNAFQQEGADKVLSTIWPKVSYIKVRDGCRIFIEFNLQNLDSSLRDFVCDAMSKKTLFQIDGYGADRTISLSKIVAERYLTNDNLKSGVDKYISAATSNALKSHEESIKKKMMSASIVSPFKQGGKSAKMKFIQNFLGSVGLGM
jgi:hypothetical protein